MVIFIHNKANIICKLITNGKDTKWTKQLFTVGPSVDTVNYSHCFFFTRNALLMYETSWNPIDGHGDSGMGLWMKGIIPSYSVSYSQSLVPGPMYSPCQVPPHGRGWINFWLSILARTGGVVGQMFGSVFIIELDAGLAGIYYHQYCTEYDVCHQQNT